MNISCWGNGAGVDGDVGVRAPFWVAYGGKYCCGGSSIASGVEISEESEYSLGGGVMHDGPGPVVNLWHC
jgi:hypothetical protein